MDDDYVDEEDEVVSYDDYVDEVQQTLSYEVTNVKSTPASTSLCHINLRFKFEIKIVDEFERQTEETIHDSACGTINIRKRKVRDEDVRKVRDEDVGILVRGLWASLQSILTCLPVSRNSDPKIIRWVIDNALKILDDHWRRNLKLPLDLDLDILIRIEETYVLDLSDYSWTIPDDYSWTIPATDSSVRLLLREELDYFRDNREAECCICLEELKLDEELLSMPCDHVFHGGCIREWLATGHHCPVCRFQMPSS